MTFVQYLQLCEDRAIIPNCIAPHALEHIFRCVVGVANEWVANDGK